MSGQEATAGARPAVAAREETTVRLPVDIAVTPSSAAFALAGRVVGRSVGDILFRAPKDADVRIGELLKADTRLGESEATLFLRVVDVEHGVESMEAGWMERVAGHMLHLDGAGGGYTLHDAERRLYKLCRCVPLGFREDGRFRKPKTIPAHFAPVERVEPADFAFLRRFLGDLPVGNLRSGDKIVPEEAGIHGHLLPHHVGIFATTGMGKSNLVKVLAAAALRTAKYGLLLVDPHGEYVDGGSDPLPDGRPRRGLLHHPRQENLVVYSSRPVGHAHHLALSSAEITISDARSIYNFTDAQNEALSVIGARHGRQWLQWLADTPQDVILNALGGPTRFNEATIGVLKRRAEQILRWTEFVHTDDSISTTRNIVSFLQEGKVVLVDTSSLWEDQELLIATVLARAVLRSYKDAYHDRERFARAAPVLIVLEEAQRVLAGRGESSVFPTIAREGRKFKVGLGAVTQQPKLVPEELLSQFNTLFILGLSDERDRAIVKGCAKQDLSALAKEIQMLEAGEALITSPQTPFALPVRIHLYEDLLEREPPARAPLPSARGDPSFY